MLVKEASEAYLLLSYLHYSFKSTFLIGSYVVHVSLNSLRLSYLYEDFGTRIIYVGHA